MANFRVRDIVAERNRCESILLSEQASDNFDLAKSLAFETILSADEAIDMLYRAERPSRSRAEYIQMEEADRIEAIITKAGPLNMDLAKHVALNTSMPEKQAIEYVGSTHQRQRGALWLEAMSYIPNPDVNADVGYDDDSDHQFQQSLLRAVAIVNQNTR